MKETWLKVLTPKELFVLFCFQIGRNEGNLIKGIDTTALLPAAPIPINVEMKETWLKVLTRISSVSSIE